MSLTNGTMLGPYEIVSPLGAGGMGEVYRARDTRLGREVAIKVLPTEFASDPERLRRFEQEARAAAALNHPNIMVLHDIGSAVLSLRGAESPEAISPLPPGLPRPLGGLAVTEQGGEPVHYIVTELLEGESLRQRLRGGPLTVAKAVDFGVHIAQGLAAAHGKGIVHRDLKPENLFVTHDGHVKILDFGLAKLLPTVASEEAETLTLGGAATTRPGEVLGTVAYMAPEQARGEPSDARSDVFSFGVVLYEMLSGKRPFERPSAADAFAALLKEDPPPLPQSLSSPLDRIVRHCLEKRPQDRYASARDLTLALETVSGAGAPAGRLTGLGRPMSRSGLPRWVLVSGLFGVLLVAALTGLLAWKPWTSYGISGRSASPSSKVIRMAVLPFANLSGDPEQEYFSDGLTQEMITQLGRLHPGSLSVIARTSVMRYKKTDTPIDQIGRELGVDYVLEGSAQREGAQVRITAELVKVSDQSQLWAESYERELSGILALQSDVAHKVAEGLALKLLPAESTSLASVRAVNPEAYDAYLKGSQYWTRITAVDLDTAERYFNLALEKDATFAPAYAGLAVVWACRQQMGFTPPSEAGPKARAAARRAVDLDDSVAEAHFALASILTWTDWDFAAAGREWQRTIDLDPSNAMARASYSHYLMHMGRVDEAMVQIDAALKGDPFNVLVRTFYGVDLVYARRYEDALAAFREALRMQPGNPAALGGAWLAYARLGRQEEALEAAKEYVAACYQEHGAERAFKEGYTEAMRRVADALAARFRVSFALPVDIASFFLEAGDKARALDWLEKGYEARDPSLPYLGWGYFDGLRSEPRFQALLRRMNLPMAAPDVQPLRKGASS